MFSRPRLCLIEDDPLMGESLQERFELEGFGCDWFRQACPARASIATTPYAAVVSDVRLDDANGEELFLQLSELPRCLPPWVFITAHGSINRAVEMMKLGAVDYITKPFDLDELIRKLRTVCKGAAEPAPAARSALGLSPAMRRLECLLPRLAAHARIVLLSGESGVGKEVVARELHRLAPGGGATPFVAVNCGALPDNLLETELFGHEKGAFTGAVRVRKGLFEQATGGTLFLDEIGDMPLIMQVKLLRAIQERQIVRVGGERAIAVDLRIVCATHRDLRQLVRCGQFREDLYYRIDVVHLRVPPLRERKEDILWLARRFLREFTAQQDGGEKNFSQAAERLLLTHPWQGNIRQLRHAVERACLLSTSSTLRPGDLFDEGLGLPEESPDSECLGAHLRDYERGYIGAQLLLHDWNVSRTATSLGISRKNLWEKMKKLGIQREGAAAEA